MNRLNNDQKQEGVLVGSDEATEWLLPWWWERYSTHNNRPVAFVDFGLSHYGRMFCQNHGTLFSLGEAQSLSGDPQEIKKWESIFGEKGQKSRKAWSQKPAACLITPFERTIWIDIDCEVLGSLDALFERDESFLIAEETENTHTTEREKGTLAEGQTLYNSGVIVFNKDEDLIKAWHQKVAFEGEHFWSDQHSLSKLINEQKVDVAHLPEVYNWRIAKGLNFHAVIVHWVGNWGKEYIRTHGGIGDALARLPRL